MDPLSDVLKSVHLEGAVFLDAEFTAPWCMKGKYGQASVKKRLAGAEHVVFFHFLTEGTAKVRLADGGEVLELQAGDMVLFPQDDRHLIGSDLAAVPLETDDIARPDEPSQFLRIRHGGGGKSTRFVCGYLACSQSASRMLFEALPRAVRIRVDDGSASMPLRELLQAAVSESSSSRPGSASMLAKLSELVFVEAMRRYVQGLPPQGRGWLAGVRDAQVGRALALLHAEPTRAWTVEQLARDVALSRSALAERFSSLVGEPPMQYLMRWRLAIAAKALRASTESIVRVAERIGYDSEAAFSRAFKREFGMPPAAWRKADVKG